MVLGDGLRIIWLDAYIGEDGQYQEFKRNFQETLESASAMPPDDINVLISALAENAAPILFAKTPAQAATLIEEHKNKRIIFISSGSLGRPMIPFISAVYLNVYRYYFFCCEINTYVDFAMDYISCLQVFNFETDLLVRLARDISEDIIKLGESYLAVEDAKSALKCFEHAVTLNEDANRIDTMNPPCLVYLNKLRGSRNNPGLIQRAQDMANRQNQSRQ